MKTAAVPRSPTARSSCSELRCGAATGWSATSHKQRLADRGTPLRARDFVGRDGHRFGLPLPSRARRQAIDQMLATGHEAAPENPPDGLR
jgi:hypothetical protein